MSTLLDLPAVSVSDVFIQPLVGRQLLQAQVTIRNDGTSAQTISVGASVAAWRNLAGQSVSDAPEPKWRLDAPDLALDAQKITIAPGKSATIALRQNVDNRLQTAVA